MAATIAKILVRSVKPLATDALYLTDEANQLIFS